jgi:hypothetical protein
MFTLKFYMHNTDSHEVFSCERYSVSVEQVPARVANTVAAPTLKLVIRMFRSLEDDNPYYETIGDKECYAHAFVVNDKGKTIDTLRAPDDVPLDLKASNLGRAGEHMGTPISDGG